MPAKAGIPLVLQHVLIETGTSVSARMMEQTERAPLQGSVPNKRKGRNVSGLFLIPSIVCFAQEQPLVEPQVSHLRQVPLRTIVKLPHSEQLSPS